jgi:hypothetical protein
MSNLEKTRLTKALALQNALADDVDELTPERARAELEAAGEDPEKLAATTRGRVMTLLAQTRKERLVSAKEELRRVSIAGRAAPRSVESIRKALTRLASQTTSLAGTRIATAYRNGREQSDSDVQSLWQDLVELGAVSDDDLAD